MNGVLDSEIGQDRNMALLLADETKTDRLESIIGDLMTELGLDLKTFDSRHSELIVVSDINFYSLCPHHLLIYRGKMHFGYVPQGKIVGLSKVPRLIQTMASRPIVQEDLVSEIADTFMSVVKPLGCVARATGRHDCVVVRGVKCHEARMTTVALRGLFREKPSLVT